MIQVQGRVYNPNVPFQLSQRHFISLFSWMPSFDWIGSIIIPENADKMLKPIINELTVAASRPIDA